jgi:dienelactone hydrolase
MVYAVTHDLVSAGFIVLLVEPDQATLTYPEVLAVVPTALSYLKHLPQIDRDRFGALGFDVGADLVIRAASTDERVKALAAIGPLFRPQEQGLALLSEMSYSQARLWGSFRGRNDLIQELAALGAVAKLEETPTALILGADDRRLDREMRHWLEAHANSAVRLWPIAGATHFTLYHSQAAARAGVSWLVERLRHGA